MERDSMYLSWEFFTLKNRITFSLLYCKTRGDRANGEVIVSPYKPECCLCPEHGSHDCQSRGRGFYYLVFGNLTSKIKSKTVVYATGLHALQEQA